MSWFKVKAGEWLMSCWDVDDEKRIRTELRRRDVLLYRSLRQLEHCFRWPRLVRDMVMTGKADSRPGGRLRSWSKTHG